MSDRLPLLILYLSERCNSRCVTCDYWRHGRRDISLEMVQRMLPSLATLRTRLVLFSGGEPLLNPQWRNIATLLKSRAIGLWLLTSGLSLAKHADEVAALFGSVTVSLDGTTPDTYSAIRGVNAFGKVCEGIRAAAAAGVPTSVRVTLQRANFRELPNFVTLARELGASQVSFLAVDVSNPHAFARRDDYSSELALAHEDIAVLDQLIDEMERTHQSDFDTRFIAESPAKLRHVRNYFAALCGLGAFPPVRCNAPDFSAVVGADGHVAPCFFIPGPPQVPGAPDLVRALANQHGQALRAAIGAGERHECKTCVCSMWRDPVSLAEEDFEVPFVNYA